MLPVLVNLGFLKIYTFGVFLMLAFLWAAFLLWKNFRLSSYKEEDVFDGLFIGIAGGLFVARLAYVILHFEDFGFSLLKFILINGFPGLSIIGFVAGFMAALYLWFRRRRIKYFEAINYFVSPAFVALGVGKIGSFLAGIEAGAVTSFPLSILYFGYEGKRHLTPLYEGLLFLLGAYIAYRILFATRRGKYPTQFNLFFFLWYFGAVTFAFDFLKDREVIVWAQSLNSLVAIILLLTISLYFIYYFRSLIFRKHKLGLFKKKDDTNKGFHKKTEDKAGRGAHKSH